MWSGCIDCTSRPGVAERKIIAILPKERLVKILRYMLDENEFLSEYENSDPCRNITKTPPFTLQDLSIKYEPAESQTFMFGGNSNWRGPVWFPINFLIIESLQKYHYYYGDSLKVKLPPVRATC